MSFTTREARGIVRKAVKRVPEGEDVRHLNITAMMDMMTILLVTFIFQASVTSNELTASQVKMPESVTSEPMPETTGEVIINANPEITYEVVVAAMDAIRADGPKTLFPDVLLSAGVN